MNQRNSPQSSDTFKEALSNIKEFILDLIRKKKERVEQETKNKVDEIVPPEQNTSSSKPQNTLEPLEKKPQEKSWFEKMKDKISGKPESGSSDDDISETDSTSSNTGQDSGMQDTSTPKQEQHFEDQDEYIPQDSEFGESLGESPRFAEIHPPYKGYYVSGRKSYFDPNTNLWAKRKQLGNINEAIDTRQKKHTYAGVMPAGLVAIPLPNTSLPDMSSMVYNGKYPPVFKKDQNNCIYMQCQEKQYVSFTFYRNQKIAPLNPIGEDSEKIIHDSLSSETKSLLDSLRGVSPKGAATKIRQYIIGTKKYSTKQQGSLHQKSNSRNYITNLDASPVLECFSVASLFAALCRELGIPCRLITGHMSQETDGGKSLLGSNNGHAWNEFWDEDTGQWIHIDATPQIKDDDTPGSSQDHSDDENNSEQGDESSETSDSESGGSGNSNNPGENQGNEEQGNESESSQEIKGEEGEQNSQEGSDSEGGESEVPSKSPKEALEELIEQAKEDSLSQQAEKLKDTIERLEDATSKEDIRDILDDAKLSDFAKDMIDDIGNNEILDQEKKEIENATDESEIERLEENSLLDDEYKKKLSEYADTVRKKIEEEKQRQKSKMERMGFSEDELHLFQTYIALEKEVEPEVRSQIRALEKILPKQYHTVRDRQNYYKSGPRIGDTGKLIEHTLTGDPNVFRRDKQVRESNEINMFESIIIDRSGSMGSFNDPNSPMRASVKAAIIRAKVLEHFKVEFNILLFDDDIEEVMAFGEVFTDKRFNTVPSRLMRALGKSGGTNIGEPLAYTLGELENYRRKTRKRSFGNISFIGDGRPLSGLQGAGLKTLVDEIRNKGYGLTAYYIGGSTQDKEELEGYFGNEQGGGTVIVPDIGQLTQKLIGSYNKGLRNVIRKYAK